MKKAFTLVELLVVVGIMGLLGTISVGGYRAMQRGMEERGVMQNVNTLIKAAYERAQIDRQPTAIYFWNETTRSESQDENVIVVGHAVAVRQQGRITRIDGGDLVDEFGDLDKVFRTDDGPGGSGGEGQNQSTDQQNTMYLYQLDSIGSANVELKRSVVSSTVIDKSRNEIYLQIGGLPSDNVGNGEINAWAFKMEDANGVTWKTGSAYGLEFAEITLPRNYLFGSSYSTKVDQPITEAGTMAFRVGKNSGSGAEGGVVGSVSVYSLRPDGSGGVKAEKVATNDQPY